MTTTQKTGAEKVRWNLDILYKGLDDPELDSDIESFEKLSKSFHESFKGNLETKLGDAIEAYCVLDKLSNKFSNYLFLRNHLDATCEDVKTKLDEMERILSSTEGEFLTFFELEIIALSDDAFEKQKNNTSVSYHTPWLLDVRKTKPYVLSEEVETALTQFSPFGPESWAKFYGETNTELRFTFQGKEQTLTQMLHILSNHSDAAVREGALKVINEGLKMNLSKLSAQALNTIVGFKQTADKKRGYKHPMDARNRDNKVPDAVVDALHDAVLKKSGPIARRYYKLKGAHLGIKPLLWSDRNASMPFADTNIIPYKEAIKMVIDAYEGFSPVLAEIIRDTVSSNWIDAPQMSEKQGGAFNVSFVLPDNTPVSFTFLNYQGSSSDVMTLAHELGHGVHGILAGKKQGTLMQDTPTAYAETASIFGEMTTFDALKAKIISGGNKEELLALLMNKLDDMVNTTVRQISFSNFERRVHGAGRRLSPGELNDIWDESTEEFYGKDGDVFSYKNKDGMWSYVPHFHSPFYVYAYAFGDLLVHSLYAKKESLGEKFEPLYLDLLRAGGTKNIVELLKPFGLDPIQPQFWNDGIEMSLGKMVTEAEELSKELGVVVS